MGYQCKYHRQENSSRNQGGSSRLHEGSALLQMNNVAPPCYNECPPVYQGHSQADVESRYLLKLSKETTDVMDGLVEKRIYKALSAENSSAAPGSINIYTRTDGFFSDNHITVINRVDTTSECVWRPDGIWRDGTRARVVNGGVVIESKLKDYGVPDEDRAFKTHRYELVIEERKKIVNYYKNNVLIGKYMEKTKPKGFFAFIFFFCFFTVWLFMFLRFQDKINSKNKCKS